MKRRRKLLGGDSAKHAMMVDGVCSIRNGTGRDAGEPQKFQMIRESGTAKVKPVAELRRDARAPAPKPGKRWFRNRDRR